MKASHDTSSAPVLARSPAVGAVERIAFRARVLRIVAAISALAVLALVSIWVAASVDALVRFPALLRGVVLCAIVALIVIDVRKFLIPAFRFRPRAIDIAQRIERQRPEFSGHLASAVDFELTGLSRTNELAAFAVRNLDERAKGVDFAKVLRLRPTLLRVLAACVCFAGSAVFALREPAYATIALRRVLTPWSDASWPARTAVESLMTGTSVAPKGAPIELRARLTKGDVGAERVFVRYRTLGDAGSADGGPQASGWTEVALSRQPSGDYSRLVDADGDRLEFVFLTRDAESAIGSIRLIEPPAIVSATLSVEPPEYARRVVPARSEQLGTGLDSRATPREPLLEGSRVRLSLVLSRPIAVDSEVPAVWMIGDAGDTGEAGEADAEADVSGGGASDASSAESTEAAERTDPTAGTPPPAAGASSAVLQSEPGSEPDHGLAANRSHDARTPQNPAASDRSEHTEHSQRRVFQPVADPTDPAVWIIEFTSRGPARVEVQLVDADGIRQPEPSVYAFDSIADRTPTAAMVEPPQDESVVADARVPIGAEHRDDLELRSAGIEIATRLGRSDSESLVFEERAEFGERKTSASIERVLDIARLQLSAGDSVVLRGFAEDHFDGLGSPERSHGRARSAPRVLRIVGEEEFERQIRSSFSGVRRDAMRIDERQAKAREQTEADAVDPSLEQLQAAITDSIAQMREATEGLLERLDRNGRRDGSLADVARQAQDIVSMAEARSAEASEALQRAARSGATDGEREQREIDAREAADRQDAVRAELEDLVKLLDRDEDAWAARRRLEGLTNRIRQLSRETQQAAQRSNGESREQLSPEARAEIDALSERQAKASEEAEKTTSELKERAKALQESDPRQAQALDSAAKAAEDGKVREEMEQASRDAAENKLEQSKAAQDRALEALRRAAEALDEDRKVRASELARVLEDLVETIRRLIAETEDLRREVPIVPDGQVAAEVQQRDSLAGSFGVLSQNTRGVAADARLRSREAARPARALDSAAVSMASAAGGLRAPIFVRKETAEAAETSLKHLDEALRLAEEAAARAEQRAEAEKREELLQKYREFLERETILRDSAQKLAPPADQNIGRRELVESRRLAAAQEELRESVRKLLDSEEEIKASEAMIDMHDIVDAALSDSKTKLNQGKPLDSVPPANDAIEALAAIVAALDETAPSDDGDMFGERQASGGDQGSGGQQSAGAIPPVAEVKLLRSMQESLARRTRSLDESSASLDPVERSQRIGELAARQERILELGSRIAEKIRGSGRQAVEPEANPATDGPSDDSKGEGKVVP
jgi:hypothetical protein